MYSPPYSRSPSSPSSPLEMFAALYWQSSVTRTGNSSPWGNPTDGVCVSKDVCESDYVLKARFILFFFQIPSCSLVWERRGQWEHSRVAVCAAMHVYKCVFCVNVCVLCECVCVLQVTAGDSSHQNQAEPILYQAKENNHRYGWKLKIQVFSFHQFSTKKVSFKGAELIFTHRFCLHL